MPPGGASDEGVPGTAFDSATPRALPLDETHALTTEQLVLANGRRVRQRVDLRATMLDPLIHVAAPQRWPLDSERASCGHGAQSLLAARVR